MSRLKTVVYALAATGAVLTVLTMGAAWATRSTWMPVVDVLASALEEPDFASIDDEQAVLRYLAAHRDQVSLTVLDADGKPVIAHAPEEPRVLASTMKVVALSALARARADGGLPAVTTTDWDSWYLPGTDGGAHPKAYDRLDIDHVGGKATSGQPVSWEQVASAMIEESDNAATDLVMHALGKRLPAESARLGEPVLFPILPVFLDLMDSPVDQVADPELRAAGIESRGRLPSFDVQRTVLHERMPRGTTTGYASLMQQVGKGTWLDADGTQFMVEALDWPMGFPAIQQDFSAFGAKGGSLPGMLTETIFLVPKDGPHQGEVLAGALFMNDMSGSAWLAMMGSFAQQRFLIRVIHDDAFRAEVEEALR